MASVSGLTGAPNLTGQPMAQPPQGTVGELAGKSVTVGGALKTIGRVALGVVTLGISELVIRLAQRGSPGVEATTGPGRAAQVLNLADAAPADQARELKRVLGDEMYNSFLAKARGRATAEGDWVGKVAERNADPDGDMRRPIPRHPYAEAVAKLTEPELVAYYASTDKRAYEQLRAGGDMQQKESVIDTLVASAVKKLTPERMNEGQILKYQKQDMTRAVGLDGTTYQHYKNLSDHLIDRNIKIGVVDPDMRWALPPVSAAVVTLYTGEQVKYYRALNAEMSRDKPDLRPDMTPQERQQAIESRENMLLIGGVLDHALEQLEPAKPTADQHGHVPEYLTVHRGANLTAADLAKYVPGAEVTEPRYTSTSGSWEKAFKGNTQFAIMGKSGRDVSFCSAYPHEREVLFPSETPFKVLHREKLEDNTTLIVLKEIDKGTK